MMSNQNVKNQVQANADEVINSLSSQVASIIRDNAVLLSLINQYQKRIQELEQQLNDQEDTGSDTKAE